MRIKFLGSGGWAGIPVAFCKCRICKRAKKNPNDKNFRTRPELYVETSQGKFLIEISPDIRLQSSKFNIPNVYHFLVSHGHFDHMGGLMQLNSWIRYKLIDKPTIYCSEKTKEQLDYEDFDILKKSVVLKPFEEFKLYGVDITAIPLYHSRKIDRSVPELKLSNEFGYILRHNGKKVAYLGDYYKIMPNSMEQIKGSDIVIMDATYLFEELYPRRSEQIGLKNDPDHLHGKLILELAKKIECKKIIYTNITHLSGLYHEELEKILPPNQHIAYDGMTFEL